MKHNRWQPLHITYLSTWKQPTSESIAICWLHDLRTILPPLLVGSQQRMTAFCMHVVKRVADKNLMWTYLLNHQPNQHTWVSRCILQSSYASSYVFAIITMSRNGAMIFSACMSGMHEMATPLARPTRPQRQQQSAVKHLANETVAWYFPLQWLNAMWIFF